MKSTRWNKENLVNIKRVKNISEVGFNQPAMTTNYNQFKRLKGNRGTVLESKRVKFFVNLILSDLFFPLLGKIYVDQYGNIQEGHHRLEALRICGKPVIFEVIPSMSIEEISTYNTCMSSKWTQEQSFEAAHENGAELAQILFDVRNKIVDACGLVKNQLSIGEIFGVLAKNIDYFKGGAKNTVKYEEFFKSDYIARANSLDFYDELKAFAEIKKEIQRNCDRVHNVTKQIFHCTLDNVYVRGFNLRMFRNNLLSNGGFKVGDAEQNRLEAIRIHNIGTTKVNCAVRV